MWAYHQQSDFQQYMSQRHILVLETAAHEDEASMVLTSGKIHQYSWHCMKGLAIFFSNDSFGTPLLTIPESAYLTTPYSWIITLRGSDTLSSLE